MKQSLIWAGQIGFYTSNELAWVGKDYIVVWQRSEQSVLLVI